MRTMTKSEMDTIGRKHGISPKFRKAFLLLANEAKIRDDEFTMRLWACKNYDECFREVMTFISGDAA